MKQRKQGIRMLKEVKGTKITIAEDEKYKICLAAAMGDGPLETLHLWLVTVTVHRVPGSKEKDIERTHMYYVLAKDADSAIAQVDSMPLPRECSGYTALEDGDVSAEATRIRFHIRGWGKHTF
jgi:hypothetical protein